MENLWLENYSGFDTQLGPASTIISTARPDMRGGYWLNFGYGAIYQLPRGGRLSVELTHPVYQDLDGVQLENDMQLFASWSKGF